MLGGRFSPQGMFSNRNASEAYGGSTRGLSQGSRLTSSIMFKTVSKSKTQCTPNAKTTYTTAFIHCMNKIHPHEGRTRYARKHFGTL